MVSIPDLCTILTLMSLCICQALSEPSLFSNVITTKNQLGYLVVTYATCTIPDLLCI